MSGKEIGYNPAYSLFFDSKRRYNILIGGAGSGKSFTTGQKIIKTCLEGKERWLLVRKFKSTIKNSVYRLIYDLILEYGIKDICDVNKTEMAFTIGESDVITSGLDDPEKIKSIQGITRVWIEEATELTEMDFDQLDLRLRGGEMDKQIICTFNPISEDHWLKRKFFEEHDPDVYILHTTYKDNLYLDDAYRDLLEQRMSKDENMYRIYVRGEWGRITTGLEFYKNFKRMNNVGKCDFIPGYPIHLSFDFNVNPYMSCSIWQLIKEGKMYHVNCIDEITLQNPRNNTEDVCIEVVERYGNAVKRMYIYGDVSGKVRVPGQRESIEHNYDVIARVLRHWVDDTSMRVPSRNPEIRIRKNFINMIFVGAFPIILKIDEKCKHMITDLENVLEDAEGRKSISMARDPLSGVVMQKYGHLSDTMDYFITQAFNYYYNEVHRFVSKGSRRVSPPVV